jgi:hypothetical protein
MKRLFIMLVITGLIAGCHPAPPSEVIKRGAGPYPYDYEAMIKDYLSTHLQDPASLKDFGINRPPQEMVLDADYPLIPLFDGQKVWECFVVYDAKTQSGKYTGNTFHVVWIRHNRIVAYDYKELELEYIMKNRFEDHTAYRQG